MIVIQATKAIKAIKVAKRVGILLGWMSQNSIE